uniref:Serine/threonine protein phosphatase 2A regulatory subunit n=1 Tax=Haptolina brevifila TaxID=156173 RepID=A0A7S2G0K5_9EUKA|mmetsp:Transcript_24777/g.49701  ORF Transcript_24777/g.49701 Transcript_24777/m.49701 type:complete len:536 (+) Transcript_24777:52-1659(+)
MSNMMKKLGGKRDSTSKIVRGGEGGGGEPASAVPTKRDGPAVASDLMAEKIEPLPSFKDTPAGERQKLFIRKLHLCSKSMDFYEANDNTQRDKEIKRLNLLEIMDYINTTKGVFNEQTFSEITAMIASNLFRGLPPNPTHSTAAYDPDEDEPVLEASWPHLQYVYEFLLRFVVSNETDPKVVKKYITQDFLVKLLDLFDSEDPRERDYLKTILHRIYGKFMPYRAFIRKSINNIFYRFIYDTERHNGIAELLEILGSIINGFALPLKDEHKQFLSNALLPLHKVHHVSSYHQQLSYCVTQFVEKDPTLADPVLQSILQFWPLQFSAKEVLFLNEVEEILEMVTAEHFKAFSEPLFKQIAICVGSPHFQVAERALFLWNNEYIVGLIAQTRDMVLPIVFESLYTNSRNHWNSTVHGLTCNVVKLFMEMDSALFDECSNTYRKKQETREKEMNADMDVWNSMVAKAKQASPREFGKWELIGEKGEGLYATVSNASDGIDDVTFQLALAQPFSAQPFTSDSPTTDALKRKSQIPLKKH